MSTGPAVDSSGLSNSSRSRPQSWYRTSPTPAWTRRSTVCRIRRASDISTAFENETRSAKMPVNPAVLIDYSSTGPMANAAAERERSSMIPSSPTNEPGPRISTRISLPVVAVLTSFSRPEITT